MSDSALNQTNDYLTSSEVGNYFGSVQSQGIPLDNKGARPVHAQGLPVEEAAKHFGITTHAVLKRLRKGSLRGFKVRGPFGEKWLVDINEVTGPAQGLPSAGPEILVVQAQGMSFDPPSAGPGQSHPLSDHLHTITAVSYTHLDVYKRQPLQR